MKQKIVTINVTDDELNGLEHFITCNPLCQHHKQKFAHKRSEHESYWLFCGKCRRVRDNWQRYAVSIMVKLFEAAETRQVKRKLRQAEADEK